MALVRNDGEYPASLSSGRLLSPFRQGGGTANVDPVAPLEAALIAAGILYITDDDVDPPLPDATETSVRALVPYDPSPDPFTIDVSEAEPGDLLGADGLPVAPIDADALASDSELAAAILAIGGRYRGAWTTGVAYKTNDIVLQAGQLYGATNNHTAGATFAGDLAGHWLLLTVGSGSGLPSNVLTKTANFTAADGDFILANAAGGAFTITLPSSGNVIVKKTDATANAVSVAGTIDGDAGGASITAQNFGAIFKSTATNVWKIVAITAASAGGGGGLAAVESGLTMIRGRVAANGTIVAGTGFTVSALGNGQYTITFTTAFSAAPAVILTNESSGQAYDAVIATNHAVGSVRANVVNQGVNVNGAFAFLAIGPA